MNRTDINYSTTYHSDISNHDHAALLTWQKVPDQRLQYFPEKYYSDFLNTAVKCSSRGARDSPRDTLISADSAAGDDEMGSLCWGEYWNTETIL